MRHILSGADVNTKNNDQVNYDNDTGGGFGGDCDGVCVRGDGGA